MTIRIAMWSGPRNISTALMRAWGSRHDTFVCDEPLYAHYLDATGKDHPGRRETLEHHDRDWRSVVAWLSGPVPGKKSIFYQKHMAHHVLPDMPLDWTYLMRNAFLIRDPREMLTSLIKHLPEPTAWDTGLPQQVELFQAIQRNADRPPVVIDARDVLEQPEPMLRSLCQALDVPYDPAMLRWDPGPRDTDGAWGPHWYQEVYATTTFGAYRPKNVALPSQLRATLDACMEHYHILDALRIHPHVAKV